MTAAKRRDADRVDCRVAYLLPHKDALVPAIEAEGVPTVCLGRGGRHLRWMWRLRRMLRTDPVDVVHAHSPVPAIGARLVLATLPARVRPRMVTTDHNVWESHVAPTRWANTATVFLDDAHLAVAAGVARSMPRRIRGRVEVLVHGLDPDAVREEAGGRFAARRDLCIRDDELVVVTVANLRRQKAYPDLLAAARLVLDERPDVRFLAAGQGPDEAAIRELHARLGLGERFRLLGYRPDAVRVLAAGDVFCLASHQEGLPVALMEAMVLGLPTVATDVGGVTELVEHGRHGLLVPPGRPELLAAALLELLADPDRRAAMGSAAAARGEAMSAEHAVRRVEDLYAEVVAR
jgi:glycosyltransferase involved in cell wall biosynthesis